MLIGGYADAHISYSSSILTSSSDMYSMRLDNIVRGFEWMYDTFDNYDLDFIVNLGDLTSNPHLRGEEISALNKCLSFSKGVPEYHILGNHERLKSSGSKTMINSIDILELGNNLEVVSFPKTVDNISFYPYPKNGEVDFEKLETLEGDVLFSHLTILDEQLMEELGMSGVSHQYLQDKFEFIVNGHIHKSCWVVKDRIINVGSLTGVSFSDKYELHYPSAFILDIDNMEIEFFENPYAMKFINIETETIRELKTKLDSLDGNNFVVKAAIDYALKDKARELISTYENIINFRIRTIVKKSSVRKMDNTDVEKITSFESGLDAFDNFLDTETEPKFPKKVYRQVLKEIKE